MRKLLDWIADRLGYQRKVAFTPIQFPPLTQELIDDGIAMGCPFPGIIRETMMGSKPEILLMTESEKEFINFRPIEINGD